MEELWGAFLALKKRHAKVYTVLDLNRMELNTEEFRHYMKEHWLHVLDREDLAIIFIEKSAMKKAIWSSIALLLGKAGRVKLFTVSEMAFDWVQRQISADDRMKAGKQSQGSMTGLPERPTLQWLQDRAQQNLIGANNRWAITVWNNVVYLKISESWTPQEGDQYVDPLAGIPGMLGEAWGRVFFIFDISNMAFKPEDLHLYVRAKWLEVLDHEEMSVCLVEAKRVRRLLLHSVYNLLGKRSRVKIMASPDEALQWVQRELMAAAARRGSEETKQQGFP
jgi:hypothetical protein